MVYKPNKPHKFGLNAWVLADSKTGYVCNWQLYVGKGVTAENDGVGLIHKVTTRLVNCVYDMDNDFSSPALFNELKAHLTGAVEHSVSIGLESLHKSKAQL